MTSAGIELESLCMLDCIANHSGGHVPLPTPWMTPTYRAEVEDRWKGTDIKDVVNDYGFDQFTCSTRAVEP